MRFIFVGKRSKKTKVGGLVGMINHKSISLELYTQTRLNRDQEIPLKMRSKNTIAFI